MSALPAFMEPKPGCLFDPARLHEIAQFGAGLPTEEAFATVFAALDRAYPGHICTQQDWIFNVAGGAMGQLTLWAYPAQLWAPGREGVGHTS